MQFRLTYEGPLQAAAPSNSRISTKHFIRRQLHHQLAELVRTHPMLQHHLVANEIASATRPRVDLIGDLYSRCGYRFVPLIGSNGLVAAGPVSACALDILFLRRDAPGGLIEHGGDIDNRIKVLFDALRIPEDCSQLPRNQTPDPDEDPFYCLLLDDRLIANVAVTTDRLLTPLGGAHVHDVKLVIHVKTLSIGSDF